MVTRWTTADIQPRKAGGFVAYGDYLTLARSAKESLDARDREAKAARALDNARENFSECGAELRNYENAAVKASEADRKLRALLA